MHVASVAEKKRAILQYHPYRGPCAQPIESIISRFGKRDDNTVREDSVAHHFYFRL